MNQSWDDIRYARHARFVSDLGTPVLELLAAKPGERVLDLGCGDGVLTARLVEQGCVVVGVDASSAMVAAAKARGLDARLLAGEALTFSNEFDAVFSNAALHWMRRADDVLSGVHRSLREGARFVAECGGEGCVQTIRAALVRCLDARGIAGAARDPWYFPTVDDYAERLRRAGFRVDFITWLPRPTRLPGDLFGWLETFATTFSAALPRSERASYLRQVRDELRPSLCDANGNWTADYTRLRFSATKQG